MNMELWKVSYSWEKVFKAQTKRNVGVTCSGNTGIEFPSQKETVAAGCPRERGWAGGSRTGFTQGLSSLWPMWCDSKGPRKTAWNSTSHRFTGAWHSFKEGHRLSSIIKAKAYNYNSSGRLKFTLRVNARCFLKSNVGSWHNYKNLMGKSAQKREIGVWEADPIVLSSQPDVLAG